MKYNMEFNAFAKLVKERIPEYLLQYDIEDVRLESVMKNNGVVCTGLVIRVRGENISPNIYLEYFYMMHKRGQDIDEILKAIQLEYEKARGQIYVKRYQVMDKDVVRENLFLKLINHEKNKEMLEGCPYIPFHDLAITFRYLVKHDEEGIASAILRDKEMELWNLTTDGAFRLAQENTMRLFPMKLAKMNDMLPPGLTEISQCPDMYVLTNRQQINGATCILYRNVLEQFGEQVECGFYILPSSIHEVLFLPDCCDIDADYLKKSVREINACAVADMDYLSDNVYYYDRKDKAVHVCN